RRRRGLRHHRSLPGYRSGRYGHRVPGPARPLARATLDRRPRVRKLSVRARAQRARGARPGRELPGSPRRQHQAHEPRHAQRRRSHRHGDHDRADPRGCGSSRARRGRHLRLLAQPDPPLSNPRSRSGPGLADTKSTMARRLVLAPDFPLRRTAQVRVIYADTDRMGVVYHATYLRFLEHARVEFIRSLGFAYADLERMGFGLPVIDLAVTYLVPAEYDDIVSVQVGLAKLTPARVQFVYELTIEPGDRHDFAG